MAKGCCGNNKLPDVLVKKRLVKAQLIDTKIGKDCEDKDVYAGDNIATCKDLEKVKKSIGDVIKGSLNQGTNLPADAEDCNRPLSICGLNNMLNAAEDNAAKQAVANAIKNKALNDQDFRIALGQALLSKEAGNRIEVRGDGIGVWDTAPPNLAVQYVDALNGDDSNPGTEAAPLRTIKAAVWRIGDKYGNYYIAIKAGQTHTIDESIAANNASLFIGPYGDPKYKWIVSEAETRVGLGYTAWMDEDYLRPTILFTKRSFTDAGGTYTRNAYLAAKSVTVYAAVLAQDDGAPTSGIDGNFMIWANLNLWLTGCIINPGQDRYVARSPSWILQYCQFNPKSGSFMADTAYGCNITVWESGRFLREGINGYPSFYMMAGNIVSTLTPENLGAQFDRPTKRLFGAATSWDIFANG